MDDRVHIGDGPRELRHWDLQEAWSKNAMIIGSVAAVVAIVVALQAPWRRSAFRRRHANE